MGWLATQIFHVKKISMAYNMHVHSISVFIEFDAFSINRYNSIYQQAFNDIRLLLAIATPLVLVT